MSSDNTVLLIEDDDAVARTALFALRHAGHGCSHARDAATAGRLFRTHAFRVVITDVNLPDGDGIELVAALQQIRRVPVIVITGNATAQSAMAALRIAVLAFIEKPFSVEQLLAELDRALAAEKILSNLSLNLGRVEAWRSELLAFETMLKGEVRTNEASATLLALTARHLMEGMADLRLQIAALVSSPTSQDAAVALNATKPLAMIEAIRDAITVLEKTKDAFRSRDLADLRQRLQALLPDRNS